MTAVTNFLKNNMLFWLLPLVLLVAKMVFDLIPYKPLFFSLTFVIMGITAFVIQKNRLDISITATRELLEFEFEDEDDVSKYGAKSAEDKRRKLRKDQSKHDRKISKLKQLQHKKKETKKETKPSRRSDIVDSDVNDNDAGLLRLLKK